MTPKEAIRTFMVRRKVSQTAISRMSAEIADSVTQCFTRQRWPIPQAIVAKTSAAEKQRLSACAYWHVQTIAGTNHVMTSELAAHLKASSKN